MSTGGPEANQETDGGWRALMKPEWLSALAVLLGGVLLASMNVLMLDAKTVCCEASEVYQMDQFDKLGFEVVPIPFRDAYPFGGALHCATTDVYREGSCEDYFPKQ